MQGVHFPKITRSELEQIHQDGFVSQDELVEAGIDIAELEKANIDINNPKDLRNFLYSKYLEDNFNLTVSELDEIYSDGKITEEEVRAHGLHTLGLSPAQIQEEMIAIKLGKDLGLTPAEIESVMSASNMTQVQLLKQLNNDIGVSMAATVRNATDTISALGGGKTLPQAVLTVGPPSPKMSMKSFITAIIKTMSIVLMAKGDMQMADAKLNEARLKDIIAITEQRIEHENKANEEQVKLVYEAIRTLDTMNKVQLAITILAMILVVALAAILIIVSGGLLAGVAIGLVAATAVGVGALSIHEANLNRKGQSMFESDQERTAWFVALMVAQILLSAGAMAGVLAAKASAEMAAQLVLAMVLFIISQTISNLVNILNMTKIREKSAESTRKEEEKAATVEADQRLSERKTDLNERLNSGDISHHQYRKELRASSKEFNTIRKEKIQNARLDYENALDRNQIIDYVVMGASMIIGIASGASMVALAKAMKEAAAKAMHTMMMTMMEFIEAIVSTVESLIGVVVGVTQLKQHTLQAEMTERLGTHKRAAAFLETMEQLFENLKKSSDNMQKRGQESIKNLIEALTSVMESNFKAMEKVTAKSV